MAYSLAPFIKQRFFDTNGDPLAGGLLYTYQSGTTTPQATYTDSTGGTANANPVVLDANGEANVWTDVSLSYKFVLKNSSGSTQWTVDNVIGLITNNAVTTVSIQDSAVTTAKIADDAVTAAKLADSASVDSSRAVTTDHIRDANITGNKLDLTTTTSSDELRNLGLTASVAANALTIALKTKAGTDASATDYINVGFRDSTSTVGTYNIRKIVAALSVVVPASTTLGCVSAAVEYLTVALIDNDGTPELAVGVGVSNDDGSIVTTSAISGGASRGTLYSTSARTGVPFRVIGRIKITEATAGTWATSPSEVTIKPFVTIENISYGTFDTANGHGSTNTTVVKFTNSSSTNVGQAITMTQSATLGDSFTINQSGLYSFKATGSWSADDYAITKNYTGPASSSSVLLAVIEAPTTNRVTTIGTGVIWLTAGDIIRLNTQGSAFNSNNAHKAVFTCTKVN